MENKNLLETDSLKKLNSELSSFIMKKKERELLLDNEMFLVGIASGALTTDDISSYKNKKIIKEIKDENETIWDSVKNSIKSQKNNLVPITDTDIAYGLYIVGRERLRELYFLKDDYTISTRDREKYASEYESLKKITSEVYEEIKTSPDFSNTEDKYLNNVGYFYIEEREEYVDQNENSYQEIFFQYLFLLFIFIVILKAMGKK